MNRKFQSTCEHGKTVVQELELPLTVEIVDCMEAEEDQPEYAVWLKSGEKWYISVVANSIFCEVQAEMIATAMRLLLASPDGHDIAIEYLKHDMDWTEIVN